MLRASSDRGTESDKLISMLRKSRRLSLNIDIKSVCHDNVAATLLASNLATCVAGVAAKPAMPAPLPPGSQKASAASILARDDRKPVFATAKIEQRRRNHRWQIGTLGFYFC